MRKIILAMGEKNMRKMICLLSLMLFVQPMLAKENWPLTVNVLSTKNIANDHGSFHIGWGGGSGAGAWSHRIAEHVFVEASDGNSYELVPNNPKDMLLPGTFQAKIEKRDMKVCEPKDNGKCREVKFKVVAAVQTTKTTHGTSETTEPAPKIVEPVHGQGVTFPTGAQPILAVESTPPGADIEIDGAFIGSTPSTVTVAPGSHQIAVKKKGFANWTRTLNVTGGTIHLNAELEEGVVK